MKRIMKLLSALVIVTLLASMLGVAAFAATKVTATGNVNIRSGPGKYYYSKGVLRKGKTATYLNAYRTDNRGVVWFKVRYNGKAGWVSSMYSYVGSGAYYSYYDDDDDIYYDAYYDYGDLVKTTASVNIRRGAGKSYRKLGAVRSGTYLTYRGVAARDSRGVLWYGVEYKGRNGWISSMYSYLT